MALALLLGCASLGGLDQAVSVDSVPRGLPVYDASTLEERGDRSEGFSPKPLGTTPFFTTLPRGRAAALVVPNPHGGLPTRFEFRCPLRWNATFLGNAPLALVGVFTAPVLGAAAYGLGLGIDFVTGAARSCPERYLFDPVLGVALNPSRPFMRLKPGASEVFDPAPLIERLTGEREAADRRGPEQDSSRGAGTRIAGTCRRYFVIPPPHPEEAVSREIESRWKEIFSRAAGPCDSFVDINEARSLLVRYNVTHDGFYPNVTAFGVGQTNVFGLRTGATHLVLLRADGKVIENIGREKDLERITYRWEIFDLHSRARTAEGNASETRPVGGLMGRPLWKRALSWTLGLFPNSVGFSFTRKDEDARGDGGVTLAGNRDRRTLPVYLSNWTLLSVYHPFQYGTWAIDADFQPQATSYFFAKTYRLGDANQRDYRLDAFYAVAVAEVLGVVHSPIGSFAGGLGLGPALIDVSDSRGYTKTTSRLLFSRQFHYTAFLLEDVFARVGYQTLWSRGDHFATGVVRWRKINAMIFTFGYFFPEARSWLQDAI